MNMNDTNNISNSESNNTPQVESVTPVDNNAIDYGTAMPSMQPQNNNSSDEKKKVIIIIGIVVVLIVVIVLIVMSNNGDDTSSSNKKDDEFKETSNDRYVEKDEEKIIYFYRRKDNSDSFIKASDIKLVDYDDIHFEELYKYECKGQCVYGEEDIYDPPKARYYIEDTDKIYQYNPDDNSLTEITFDKEIKLDDIIFKISNDYIAAYNSKSVTVDKDALVINDYKSVEVNGVKTTEYQEIYATRESLKDNIYAISSDFSEYILYKVYDKDNKIAEIKANGKSYVNEMTYDGKYVILKGSSNSTIIVSKSGKVQKYVGKDQYIIYNDRLIVANDSGNVEVYSEDNLLSTIEAKNSKVTEKGYVVVIKDDKLQLYDAVSNKLISDIVTIKSSEVLGKYKYASIVTFSSFANEDTISVFLEDTSKQKEGNKIFGRTIRYNITQNKIISDEESYKIISE